MSVRESINRNKIEHWRVAKVPIDATETIYQGDALMWDAANHRATKATSGAVATSGFIGINETQNPTLTAGSLTSDLGLARVVVIQSGLFEMLAGEAMTVYPFDYLFVGGDPQSVVKTGATANNHIGKADPAIGAAGKTYAVGDKILVWINVATAYRVVP